MSVLNLLKTANLGREYKSFKDLPVGSYVIKRFSLFETTYGVRVRIEINDWYMFLPERFTGFIRDENIADLNAATVVMTYSGKDMNNQSRLILDFDVITINEAADELTTNPVLNEPNV